MISRARTGQFALAVAVAVLALTGCSSDEPAEGDSVSTTSTRAGQTSSSNPPSSTSLPPVTTSQVVPQATVPDVVVPPETTPVYIPPPAPSPLPPVDVPAPEPAPVPTRSAPSVFYKNCTAVRAANADPIYAGDPGYSRDLDRDGDGVACE
ncbi:hypothetical protein CH254_04590 [Rhodococcus sp. 06-412-2C]|uniref:excalibur calcium-binding domain-containing protein n=1 Tax=unclassified Rhodococcus (in: high G+C Gram-positive bacteria) TaxID=192944 RepID=UPI000B9A3DD9|nr:MULTISPECIES: excalibur calcium-binding domain-containing protein [unclassified Rhodococcus (in: high G+C Gram-positive bacteria)]OZC91761.1 hypothetical protein CH254_04590 [Rhodococcus sp. 06-412-2C]OZC92329.1 hypothetical protein CH279_25865 [Rhodococcus sp. 06-412-2B]